MRPSQLFLLISFCFFIINTQAQIGAIPLVNPSFEGIPLLGQAPPGWRDCGKELFPKESAPDVHPTANKTFGVTQRPKDRATYMGMVVRGNGTWESVSQKLVAPIHAEQAYVFNIKLCKSDKYLSSLRKKKGIKEYKETQDFIDPIVLRIWGGSQYCHKDELLAQSPLIKNTDWKSFTFRLDPEFYHTHITLEAYRGEGETYEFPNGNILLDDASVLLPIDSTVSNDSISRIRFSKYNLNENNLRTKEDLQWYVIDNGYHLGFNEKNLLTLWGKSDLNYIIKAVKKFPEQKLVFLFEGKKKKVQQLKKSVEDQFIFEDLPTSQWELRRFKEADRKKNILISGKEFYVLIE